MIRDWKDKAALAAIGVGVAMLIGLGAVLLVGFNSNGEELGVQITPLVTPTSVHTTDPTPSSIQETWQDFNTVCEKRGLVASDTGRLCVTPDAGQDQEAARILAEVKAHLASIGSMWCPARYLSWLYYQGEEYQTNDIAAAYWLALGEPCSQPGPFIDHPGNGGGPTRCCDGMWSHSSGPGTCSHHGGVC